MIRYTYNQQVAPPAPFVHVNLTSPLGDKSLLDVPAQLDTAADKTVFPGKLVDELGLDQTHLTKVMGFDGVISDAPLFLVQIAIRGQKPQTVEALSSYGEPFILLGRDVLNTFRIVLDGPNQALEIH